MSDLSGWVRFWVLVTFRPQRAVGRALCFTRETAARLVRVEKDRYRYQRALQRIRDAAPTRSTAYAVADAALKGQETP